MGLDILKRIFLLWTFLLKQSNPSIDTPKFENECWSYNPNHHVTEYDDACTSNDELLCRVQHPALKEKDHTGVASAAGKLSMIRLICKAHSPPLLLLCPLTAKPLMYMSVPPTQKLSPFEAVVVIDSVDAVDADEFDEFVVVVVVVSSLHSQWQVSTMLAQFSVISSVQQGSDSAVTHSDWDWNTMLVIIIISMSVVTMEHWSGRGRQSIQQ